MLPGRGQTRNATKNVFTVELSDPAPQARPPTPPPASPDSASFPGPTHSPRKKMPLVLQAWAQQQSQAWLPASFLCLPGCLLGVEFWFLLFTPHSPLWLF